MSRLRFLCAGLLVVSSLASAGLTRAAASGRSAGASPLALVAARTRPASTPIQRGSCRAQGPSQNSCFIIRGRKLTPVQVAQLAAAQRAQRSHARVMAAPRAAQAPANGYGPLDLEAMYGVAAGTTPTTTVGIVDWDQDPTIESDMNAYRSQFGLPACTSASGCFHELAQNNGTVPVAKRDEIGEITLDVEAVSALCPTCHITLVDAYSSADSWLYPAIDALAATGVHYISMSFGGSESAVESGNDARYIARPETIYVAATGDNGYDDGSGTCGGVPICDPASASNVVAAGGTSVLEDSQYYYLSAWKGAGSGCARHSTETAVQKAAIGDPCQGGRATSDISALADPNTGAATYSSADGWQVVGGTSLAAPLITTLYAIAGNDTNPYPFYTNSSPTGLFDITHGSTIGCPGTVLCAAGAGWDGPTGMGTPTSPSLFGGGTGSSALTVSAVNGTSATVTVGQAMTGAPFAATGGSGQYRWAASGLPAGVTVNSTTGAWSGAPTAAGTYDVVFTAADAASPGTTGTATFTLTVQQGSGLTLTTASGSPAFVLALKSNAINMPMASAHGATSGLTWSATGLPPGLAINPTSGAVVGKPTAVADYPVAVTAANAAGGTATLNVDFEVVTAYTCSTQLLGRVGHRLTDDCANYWSTAPNHGGTWVHLPGHVTYSAHPLPTGLSLNAHTGVISGTPSRTGQGSFVVTSALRPDGVLLTKATTLTETVRYTIRR